MPEILAHSLFSQIRKDVKASNDLGDLTSSLIFLPIFRIPISPMAYALTGLAYVEFFFKLCLRICGRADGMKTLAWHKFRFRDVFQCQLNSIATYFN